MSIKRQRKRNMIISFIIGFIFATGLLLGSYLLIGDEKVMAVITQLSKKSVEDIQYQDYFVAATPIKMGQQITQGDVVLLKIPVTSSLVIESLDKSEIIGKTARIDIPSQLPLINSFFYEPTSMEDDERIVECQGVFLPHDLKTDEMVDVRIAFPTGQDYTLLSKKRITKMAESIENTSQSIWLILNENEILKLSSAYVDQKEYPGTTIYLTRYLDPQLQTATMPNYPVNLGVLSLMKINEYGVESETSEIDIQLRYALESAIVELQDEDNIKFATEVTYDVAVDDAVEVVREVPIEAAKEEPIEVIKEEPIEVNVVQESTSVPSGF